MNGISFVDLLKQIPNFAGLVILAATLWQIYQQSQVQNEVLLTLLVNCFTAQGTIR